MKLEDFEKAEKIRNNIKKIELILAHLDQVDSLKLYQGEEEVLEIKTDNKSASIKGILDQAKASAKAEFTKLITKLQTDFDKL